MCIAGSQLYIATSLTCTAHMLQSASQQKIKNFSLFVSMVEEIVFVCIDIGVEEGNGLERNHVRILKPRRRVRLLSVRT